MRLGKAGLVFFLFVFNLNWAHATVSVQETCAVISGGYIYSECNVFPQGDWTLGCATNSGLFDFFKSVCLSQ